MSESDVDKSEIVHSGGPHVAIIGAGLVGVALAKRLVQAGRSVSLSNSRGPETLRHEEELTGARALPLADAVSSAELVVLAVPLSSIIPLQAVLRASLRPDAIVVDAGNYYPSRDGRIEALDRGIPDSVWVSQILAPTAVVKAFNNIIADNIDASARPKSSAGKKGTKRVALPASGNNNEALEAVMKMMEDVGFDAYNAGALEDSWRYQPGQPAYCTEPTMEQLPGLLARADREQGPVGRDKVRTMLEKLPADFPASNLLRIARLQIGFDRWDVRSYFAVGALSFALLRGSVAKA